MLSVVFLFLILASCNGLYQEFYSEDLICSGQPTVRFVPNRACTSFDEQPGCTNFINLTGYKSSCPTAIVLPPTWASIQGWASVSDCSGVPDYTISIPPNKCSGYWDGPTMELDCATRSIKECKQDYATCDGCPSKPANADGVCTTGNPTLNFPMLSYIFTCPHRCESHHPTAILESGQSSIGTIIGQFAMLLAGFLIFVASCATVFI